MSKPVIWCGNVGPNDDFGAPIGDEFIDGKTRMGPWGIMTPANWSAYGVRQLGQGFGQRYKKQPDGKFHKVEG